MRDFPRQEFEVPIGFWGRIVDNKLVFLVGKSCFLEAMVRGAKDVVISRNFLRRRVCFAPISVIVRVVRDQKLLADI